MPRILILLLSLLPAVCSAQSLADFKSRLTSPDPESRAGVRIVEVGSAAAEVARLSAQQHDAKIKGYRVIIFFDNSQSARSGAAEAQRRFKEFFDGVPTYMTYENPYFKVAAGNCVTTEEAIILKGRIAGAFPSAFVSKEDIPVTVLSE